MQSITIAGYTLGEVGHRPQHSKPPRTTPEYSTGVYRDRGCAESPTCLACPLQQCIYDLAVQPGTLQEMRSRRRRAEIISLLDNGMTVRQVQTQLGISWNTINRALKHEAK